MRKLISLMMILLILLSAGLAAAQEVTQEPPDQDVPVPVPVITITSPAPGAILPNLNAITITGTGAALFENSLTVQARDAGGGILAQQPVTTNAPEVGGTGNWQVTLAVSVTPGSAGTIRAFATSANDGSLVAEAIINVTYGSSADPVSITINTPAAGSILPNSGSFLVSGVATNAFEGNVVVQARDAAGNVLAQQPATAAAQTNGSWQVSLSVNVAAGTHGTIRAFSPSPADGRELGEVVINVSYGAIPVDVDLQITFPTEGSAVNTVNGITVTGTSRNISDGRVVVQVRDGNNRVLAERQTQTTPAQGNGNWQAVLTTFFTANTSGSIYAFAPGVGDGGQFLSDTIFVTFQANCAPRGDWPTYFVQRGDTLSSIARRVGSSTAELAQANCLNNVNIIEVGQQLRVPRQPVVPTQPPSPSIITIIAPQTGTVLDTSIQTVVTGTGSGLGSVTVQALDAINNVLAAQTVVVSGGRWQANLAIAATPGTQGRITAFATSPTNGSVIASASISVTYGQPQPAEAALVITSPTENAVLNPAAPITISGTGSGLFENNVIARALDNEGRVLAEQPATIPAGQSIWSLNLNIPAPAGTRGVVYAYSVSPVDGSVVLADAVNVLFGAAASPTFVTITDPLPYSTINDPASFKVSGMGGGLFENNVVVRALDSAGNVLVEQPTIAVTNEVGGSGPWEITLNIVVAPGTRGALEAYSTSAEDGSINALARIPVIFGQPEPGQPFVLITAPLPNSPVTAERGVVASGYASGLTTSDVTVQIIDAAGNILASRTAPVDSETGVWQAPLTLVSVEPGTTGRMIVYASGAGGAVIASDSFEIAFAALNSSSPAAQG